MNREELKAQIFKKKSYLITGLDTDLKKIPQFLLKEDDPVFTFNKGIIDATAEYSVGYKINTAFYEANGARGWESMAKTVEYIPKDLFTIADAKRGDIGNTADQYAKAFFETIPFDAITVAPYMGTDSVQPFLKYKNKWAIVLGLTSNPGAADFELQHLQADGNPFLYEKVLTTTQQWGTPENLMFVVGATQAAEFEKIRRLAPQHFFLVPGLGAQGGSLREISEKTLISDGGILVNASRAIIYAGSGKDFAVAAQKIAKQYQTEMETYLSSILVT